jgi:hypothetical protein
MSASVLLINHSIQVELNYVSLFLAFDFCHDEFLISLIFSKRKNKSSLL